MLPVNGGINTALSSEEIRRVGEQQGIKQEEPDGHGGLGKCTFPLAAA